MADKKENSIVSFVKKNTLLVVLFFVLFLFFSIIPPVYDRWGSFKIYSDSGGLLGWIRYVFDSYYNYLNGRIASNIFGGWAESFTSGLVWNIMCASVTTGIVYVINKLVLSKNANVSILLFIALFFMADSKIRIQVYFYAFSVYIPPVLLLLIFLWALNEHLFNPEYNKKLVIPLMMSTAFCISTWVENIGFGFCASLGILTLIITYKRKKFDWVIWLTAFVSAIGGIFMILSPGLYQQRTVISSEISLIETILQNFKNISSHIFYLNRVFFIIFFIITFFYACTAKAPKLFYKYSAIFSSVIGVALFTYFSLYAQYIVQEQNVFKWRYIILIGVVFLINIPCTIILSRNKLIPLFLLGVGILSLGIMLPTPNNDFRVSSIGFFVFVCLSIIFFNQIDFDNRKLYTILVAAVYILFFLVSDQMILTGRRIFLVQSSREKIMSEIRIRQSISDWDYEKPVVLPSFRAEDIWNGGRLTPDSFHYPQFLYFYGLNPKTKVLFSNDGYYADGKIDNGILSVWALPESVNNNKWKYTVYFTPEQSTESVIFDSIETEYQQHEWKITQPGKYRVEITMLSNYGVTLVENSLTLVYEG